MAQSSVLGQIANVPGAAYRLDANLVAQALATFSAGSAPPDPTYPRMLWWDTTLNRLKMRNPANSGWVEIGSWTGDQFRPFRDGLALGTAATRDAGSGADQLVALDGQGRLPALDGSQLINLGSGAVTGDLKLSFEETAPVGWLFCDGKTVGPVASGAAHAGAGYQPLFHYLWERLANAWCPLADAGGAPVSRGASALADWDAARRLALPDARGSVLLVRDAMGGVAAGRVTPASTGGANAAQTAARGGAEAHTLSLNQIPSHDHGGGAAAGAHSHTYAKYTSVSYGGQLDLAAGGYEYGARFPDGQTAAAAAHSHPIPAQGGGQRTRPCRRGSR